MPNAIDLHLDRTTQILCVRFDDDTAVNLPAEYMRVESPSAEVQGHGPGQRKLVAGKRAVRITGIEPVGNYAVLIRFDDGHDTGIFSWEYLHQLGHEHDARWPAYLDALREAGLTRD